MAVKEIILTQEGLEALEKELDYLKSVRRKEVAEKIKVALSFATFRRTASMTRPKTSRPLWKPVLPILRSCSKT